MFRKTLLALAGATTLFIAGCGAQPGTSIVKFEKGSPARMTEAPAAGKYALYSRMAANPEVSYDLKKGDQIGFKEEDGKIYAVAGSHKDEVKVGMMGAYYWKQQTEK